MSSRAAKRPRGKAPASQRPECKGSSQQNLERVKTYKRLKTLKDKCVKYSKGTEGAGVVAVFVTPTGAIHA